MAARTEMAARPEVKQKCKLAIGEMAKQFKNFRKDKRPETKKSSLRINRIRRQLEELKVKKPEMKKRINKILGRVKKDLEDDSIGYPDPILGLCTYTCDNINGYRRLIYDRGIATDYPPEIRKELKHSAKIAIDFFNQRNCTEYCMVDVVTAIVSIYVPDYVFDLVFTAKQHHKVEDAKTFKARISHGINPTRVEFVIMGEMELALPEEDSSSSSFCGSRERRKMAAWGYDGDARVSKIISLITELQQKETTKEEEEKLETERPNIKINDIMRQVEKLRYDKLEEEKELKKRKLWFRRIVAQLSILRTVDLYPAICLSDGYETVIYDQASIVCDDTEFLGFANKAIECYNKGSPVKYRVVDLIRATRLLIPLCGRGRDVCLKFTAAMPNKAAETFESMLHFGTYPGAVGKVQYVRIVS